MGHAKCKCLLFKGIGEGGGNCYHLGTAMLAVLHAPVRSAANLRIIAADDSAGVRLERKQPGRSIKDMSGCLSRSFQFVEGADTDTTEPEPGAAMEDIGISIQDER